MKIQANLPSASSLTHEHLLGVIVSELEHRPFKREIRILDVGCGDGKLMVFLALCLAELMPDRKFILQGFDVSDHGVQQSDYFQGTIERLSSAIPDVRWCDRLRLIGCNDPWPYPDDSFDIVVSNQVLEHVDDHSFLLRELYRVLGDGAFSCHLFPLAHTIQEGHLWIPLAHWFRSWEPMHAYIRLASRLGIGKFRRQRKNGWTLDQWAECHADYIYYYTNYMRQSQVLRLAKQSNLRASFKYTGNFYTRKLRQILRLPRPVRYRSRRIAVVDEAVAVVCRYASSVTLFLEKRETYRKKTQAVLQARMAA